MKILRNIFACLAAACLLLCSCEEADNVKDLGYALVYIPQATSTGLDNSYNIPQGPLDQNTYYVCRYNKDSGDLEIALGVTRSGYLHEQKAFTVDLGVCEAQTQSKLDEYAEKGTPATAIPTDICTIPSKISVEAGKNTGTCYVGVNLKKLAMQQASLYVDDTYKLLVLGLEISNPTEYELAEKNTSVVIILNLNHSAWDSVSSSAAEAAVRTLFPLI